MVILSQKYAWQNFSARSAAEIFCLPPVPPTKFLSPPHIILKGPSLVGGQSPPPCRTLMKTLNHRLKKGNGDFFRIMILQRDHSIVMRSNPSGLETEQGPALCGQWVGNRARPCWGLTAHSVHLRTAYGVTLFRQSCVRFQI